MHLSFVLPFKERALALSTVTQSHVDLVTRKYLSARITLERENSSVGLRERLFEQVAISTEASNGENFCKKEVCEDRNLWLNVYLNIVW